MVCELNALSCSLFGSLVREYCGMREIIDYSKTRKVLYSYIPFGG